jgi:hypothetical protein
MVHTKHTHVSDGHSVCRTFWDKGRIRGLSRTEESMIEGGLSTWHARAAYTAAADDQLPKAQALQSAPTKTEQPIDDT